MDGIRGSQDAYKTELRRKLSLFFTNAESQDTRLRSAFMSTAEETFIEEVLALSDDEFDGKYPLFPEFQNQKKSNRSSESDILAEESFFGPALSLGPYSMVKNSANDESSDVWYQIEAAPMTICSTTVQRVNCADEIALEVGRSNKNMEDDAMSDLKLDLEYLKGVGAQEQQSRNDSLDTLSLSPEEHHSSLSRKLDEMERMLHQGEIPPASSSPNSGDANNYFLNISDGETPFSR